MSSKDRLIVEKAIEKVMKEFDFDIDYVLESKKEDVEELVREEILENIDSPPYIDWIRQVELDDVEAHKNKNGDFLSN